MTIHPKAHKGIDLQQERTVFMVIMTVHEKAASDKPAFSWAFLQRQSPLSQLGPTEPKKTSSGRRIGSRNLAEGLLYSDSPRYRMKVTGNGVKDEG
ncbi:MAG: hypothetical protein CBC13_07375 [Planctomycetia bacterium TMED53]|nr:MAG: hypothetical protein CBC13_07375 [Planctomycetia bacterium TMED53]